MATEVTRVPRFYIPTPEETTPTNKLWQGGAVAIALAGIALVVAGRLKLQRPWKFVAFAGGGAISLLSLTMLYLLRSIDKFMDRKGTRPFHLAVEKRNERWIWWLLFFGANPNAQNSNDETPLHSIVKVRQSSYPLDLDIMRQLIFAGANVNAIGFLNNTPLHEAVKELEVGKVKLLREHGADFNRENSLKETPLGLALKAAQESYQRDKGQAILNFLQ